jgi:hypothetical protein
MLEETYMVLESYNPGSEQQAMISSNAQPQPKPKRHSANLNTDVFKKLGIYIAKWGNTKEAIVNQAVEEFVAGRQQFLKMYAPHLTLENTTSKAIFIYDNELEKTAVVRAKWNELSTNQEKRSLITLNCEVCDNSESCIHVRYSLALPGISRLQKEEKLV